MMRFFKVVTVGVVVASAGALASAQGTATAQKSLYDRLGGRTAIVAVVDDFVANAAGDKRISSFFTATAGDKARLTAFKNNLVEQICQAAGGPCTYRGKDMRTAHAGMGITTQHFAALVEDLVMTLNKFKVGKAEQDQLLGVLGPMQAVIVEKK